MLGLTRFLTAFARYVMAPDIDFILLPHSRPIKRLFIKLPGIECEQTPEMPAQGLPNATSDPIFDTPEQYDIHDCFCMSTKQK